ncbi:MAG: Deoxycytidine triphosphate deaminase [Candidatus Heimdallarchaeota archaeon LC_3]|nr:MAG: Deoxycytidine triphosphate deaminase [Candidatus Heimdallarchaeota archaeon LC_3]
MILSGIEIKDRLDKDIIIKPYDEKYLNPNSYNLRLHDELIYYTNHVLDMKKKNETERTKIPEEGFTLQPNKLYLGRTLEYTETHNLVPMLEGRSSIGRLGLAIHITAGFGDVGFSGYWTLEIFCLQPVKIYPFVPICQIYYHTIEGKFNPYKNGKYQNNKDIQPSCLYKEFKE